MPTENLRQLIFISTARTDMSEDDLKAILYKFRPRNGTLGITGMLLYCEGHFMQVLEGPHDVVEHLYAQIRRDPRHTDHHVMLDHVIPERQFGDWQMAFRSVRKEDLRRDMGYLPWDEVWNPVASDRASQCIQYFHDTLSLRA